MSIVENMPYDKMLLLQKRYDTDGKKQNIYLQKTRANFNNSDQFFIKIYGQENKANTCLAYIYFYLNIDTKTSDFIGLFVKPNYRNLGLATYLVALWISFCFENNYDFLGTNKTQRKPFLLYLLKTYGFEIFDIAEYDISKHTISICKKDSDPTKYLYFKNQKSGICFMNGKIAREDNYQLITNIDDSITFLDNILLSKPYSLVNDELASNKTDIVLKRMA